MGCFWWCDNYPRTMITTIFVTNANDEVWSTDIPQNDNNMKWFQISRIGKCGYKPITLAQDLALTSWHDCYTTSEYFHNTIWVPISISLALKWNMVVFVLDLNGLNRSDRVSYWNQSKNESLAGLFVITGRVKWPETNFLFRKTCWRDQWFMSVHKNKVFLKWMNIPRQLLCSVVQQ